MRGGEGGGEERGRRREKGGGANLLSLQGLLYGMLDRWSHRLDPSPPTSTSSSAPLCSIEISTHGKWLLFLRSLCVRVCMCVCACVCACGGRVHMVCWPPTRMPGPVNWKNALGYFIYVSHFLFPLLVILLVCVCVFVFHNWLVNITFYFFLLFPKHPIRAVCRHSVVHDCPSALFPLPSVFPVSVPLLLLLCSVPSSSH